MSVPTATLKIMPLGDSITQGTVAGGYRAPLYSLLVSDGYNISYVGEQDTNPGGGLPSNEENHEGIGGDTSVNLRTQIDTSGIVQSSLPNVVLLLVGTNDLGYGASDATTDSNIAALIDDVIGKDPTVHILLANVLHRVDDGTGWVTAFNATLPSVVAPRAANVTLVDMASALTLADLDPGGLHPTQAGYDKMAAVWEAALNSYYGVQPPVVQPPVVQPPVVQPPVVQPPVVQPPVVQPPVVQPPVVQPPVVQPPVVQPPVVQPPVVQPPVVQPPVVQPPVGQSSNAPAAVVSVAAPAPEASTPGLSVQDISTNQHVVAAAQAYSGPVAGIANEYLNLGSDNLNITVDTPNWFIHSGSGNDAFAVSSGTNVLDGGAGSNFLKGGTGSDTFYIDDRNATSTVWSTIVNFHAGDSTTVWGVTASDFKLTWLANQGAVGATGLTGVLVSNMQGHPQAALTLAGYTQADLTNGRLSISYGTTTDLPGLPGSSYMTIHGN